MDINNLYDLSVKKVNAVFTIYTEKNKVARRVNRPSWGIILKYDGETKYNCNGKKYISNKNNMIILPKGSNYEWTCVKEGKCHIIEFECDSNLDTIFSLPINNPDKILQLFKDCEYKTTLKNPVYKIAILKNVYDILFLMLSPTYNLNYQSQAKRQKITPAVDYIVKNYNKKIKNQELAQIAGTSTVYFRKIFTAVFGVSPITYIHQLRINKSKEILKSDYNSLTEVALSVGYTDLYDFSRTFKKHVGISPSRYAINHKNQINKN